MNNSRCCKTLLRSCALALLLLSSGCTTAYYAAMEKVGVHKRDILIDRVEEARDASSSVSRNLKMRWIN